MIRRGTTRTDNLRGEQQVAGRDAAPLSRHDEPGEPRVLHFSPTAWAKLLFLRDLADCEVGGFGITAADDLLLIEDVQLVKQVVTGASVAFDDQAVAEFFDQQVDAGRKPEQFARVWVHTHPGGSPDPSLIDEDTFLRVFGRTAWAVMFILARGGQSYACLRFHVGPGSDISLPVRVDYSRPFPASDQAAWKAQYAACVQVEPPLLLPGHGPGVPADTQAIRDPRDENDWLFDWDELLFDRQPRAEAPEADYAI